MSALWLSSLAFGLPLAVQADTSSQPPAARERHAPKCRGALRSTCGSDGAAKLAEKRKARREAAAAKREAAAAKREEAKQARLEASQSRREAYLARREQAQSAAKDRREEARNAALARREAWQAKREEAKQRREAAAAERRERVAARSEAKRTSADEEEEIDDSDDTQTVASAGGFGTLRVNSRPWAQVYVDGRMVGHTPQLGLNVPAGEHQVRLVNPMFAMSKAFRLKVRGGERITRVEMLEE